MLELYQFELSQYSEKVRLILDYKQLNYRKIEVTPGIGQLELLRLTGQKQVPVLKDGDRYIVDSTEIAKYLDEHYPERPIIPKEGIKRGLCLMMEEWADESIGLKGRKALFSAISQDQYFRRSLLPTTTPDILRTLVEGVPSDVFKALGFGVGYSPEAINQAIAQLKQDLEALCLILAERPYLTGDEPTLADLAVAGLSILLKFPEGDYLDLPASIKGKGVAELVNDPAYERFFTWREQIYTDFRRPISGFNPPADTNAPTSIQID